MTRKKIDVATGFSSDPTIAERIADRNFNLKVQRDPSILSQEIQYDAWPYTDRNTGAQMYGCKYFYWGENNSPIIENHPSIAPKKKAKVA